MTVSQKIIPYKGIDLESDETLIEQYKAVFIKNITFTANKNGTDAGANKFSFTPFEGNELYTNVALPAGENYCIGFHAFREKRQAFAFIWNSTNQHMIYRVNGSSGTCEKVFQGPCLNFKLDPKHFISEGRCVIETTTRTSPVSGLMEEITYLIFTENSNDLYFLCVEDSIATNGFNATTFPFFANNDPFCSTCNNLKLGVAPPMDCIKIAPVARNMNDPQEANRSNLMALKGWQFRLRYIDIWGRPSEYGRISDQYLLALGGACVSGSGGLSRSVRLTFNAGCPTIDKIEVLIRNCNGNTRGLSQTTDWYLVDTIEKYDNTQPVNWWERQMNPDVNYNAATNEVEYVFSGDKVKTPVPVDATNRNENPMPLTSSSVFPMNRFIGVARNKRRFEPLDDVELNKVKYTVTAPTPVAGCDEQKVRKIKIYGMIFNPYEDEAVRIRVHDGTPVFGVADCYGRDNNPFSYGQTLPKGQEGIIAYLAGTNIYAISKQYKYDQQTGAIEFLGVHTPIINSPFDTRYIALQVWEFEVPAGKYVFRIASHNSAPADNYQSTSTRFIGQADLNGTFGQIVNQTTELIIDVCTQDVEIKDNPVVIYDLTRIGKGCGVVDRVSVVEGYLYEDEVNKIPVERAKVVQSVGADIGLPYTDHNGYYFCATRRYGMKADFYGTKNCAGNQFLKSTMRTFDSNGALWRNEKLYVYTGLTEYPAGDRYTIKGKIVLCNDNNVGIAGALVVHTRGGYGYTNSAGEFTIVAHNNGDTMAPRQEKLIYSQRGTCVLLDCNTANCNSCFADEDVLSPPCNGQPRSVTVTTRTMRIKNFNKRGPHMGGRYGLGFIMHDWMGRQSFVQANDKHYVNIPTLHETKTYDFSSINFDLTGVVFPAWVRYVTFCATENLEYDDYLHWAVDRIQFVDNTGNTNNVSPSAIRLYYEGLGEYNKQKGFATNTTWDFIIGDAVVGSDQVEFMANGDGVIYGSKIRLQVQYDKDGRYIQVDYTDDLKDLKAGALIKLIRPKANSERQFYYELCPTVRVVNGVAQMLTGKISLVDAYLQGRQIPVPVETGTVTNNGITTSITENQLRSYPFPFEHHSPSDTWGDHCWNKGRVSVKNPEEKQHLLKTEIAVSQSLSTTGTMNMLHYFEDARTEIFDEQEWGGISIGLTEINTLLVLCEHDNFVVPFSDDSLTFSNGQLRQRSGGGLFGRPERKIGNNYGCQLDYINTIRRRHGLVIFVDAGKASLVKHNYNTAEDISTDMKSYLVRKIKYIEENNRNVLNPVQYMHGVIDPKHDKYILTHTRLKPQDQHYINDLAYVDPQVFDSVSYSLTDGIVCGWHSYVPEYYGALEGDRFDQQLISFRRGLAWRHHNINGAVAFNTFYGTVVDWYIEVVYNLEHTKVKLYLWNEVYSKHPVFIDRIQVEGGQQSRLMPRWWSKFNQFWAADFKCAINTQVDANRPVQTGANALLDGDSLQGRWMKARYKGRQADRAKYFELSALVAYFAGQELSGDK